MLFNSPPFLFAFLPLLLIAFAFGVQAGGAWPTRILAFASFFFYAWWDVTALPILLVSIGFNWIVGQRIVATQAAGRTSAASRAVALGVVVNLVALAYYKYSGFVIHEMIARLGFAVSGYQAPRLPIGISFFTFTQIAYLVDMGRHETKGYGPLKYALFVNYFPHVIAGPILHHADMMPQFDAMGPRSFRRAAIADGFGVLLVGLAKKLLLADPLGIYANAFYNRLGPDVAPGFFECLVGVMAYALQLYFDFSGYSDMAIGISRMFGVELPLNFNSPYKAVSIIDFWRRWHISLSSFLRDYLYIPLGGSRRGAARRYLNLFVTMALGGLWHGAGWTFLVWGALHGALLIMNHAWRALIGLIFPPAVRAWLDGALPARAIARSVTLVCVVLAWIPFRAATLQSAVSVFQGLAGQNGATLPAQVLALAPRLHKYVASQGTVALLADGTVLGFAEELVLLALAGAIALWGRNTQESSSTARLTIGALLLPLILQKVLFARHVEFLYFQF
jgi:alginate O-acetyltransferase complex protein AlgI